MITSLQKILKIHRLNRRTQVGNDIQYTPSRTICVKFAGQSLPNHVYFYNCRYPVYPFIPKARICYECYRIGHLKKICKSKPRCLHCGDLAHDSPGDCANKPTPPKCLNWGSNLANHLATSHECPEVIRHKMALSLAANNNISYLDARRSVYSSSPSPSSLLSSHLPLDPRSDFRNYPPLPQTNSHPSSPSFSTNRFAPLADLPQQDYANNTFLITTSKTHSQGNYSQAVLHSRFPAASYSRSPLHSYPQPPLPAYTPLPRPRELLILRNINLY